MALGPIPPSTSSGGSHDSGQDDYPKSLWIDPDGTELIATGWASGEPRIDRMFGGSWHENTDMNLPVGLDITSLPSGEFLAAGGSADGGFWFLRYDSEGNRVSTERHDWSPQNQKSTSPTQLKSDKDGNIYLAGSTDDGSTDLLKFGPDESIVWSHYDGFIPLIYPFSVYNMDVGENDVVFSGTQDDAAPNCAALRYDLDGELIAAFSPVPFEVCIANDVAVDSNGEVLVGGGSTVAPGCSATAMTVKRPCGLRRSAAKMATSSRV